MKRNITIVAIASLLVIMLFSCKNELTSAGGSTLEQDDNILIGVDTFGLQSAHFEAFFTKHKSDSLLLGECDTRFGTIEADILTQFSCPEGFAYPEGSELDSACFYLYYNSYYGSGNSPLALSLYKMDKKTLSYDELYAPDEIAVEDYCNVGEENFVIDHERVILADSPRDSAYSSELGAYVSCVRFRLKQSFADSLFAIRDFSSQDAFLKHFYGLYVTTHFGSATLLHVGDMGISLHYHYNYHKKVEGKDTVVQSNDVKMWYASNDVRRVNRISYPNKEEIIKSLENITDTNYVVAPANVYTALSINLGEVAQKIDQKVNHKRAYINKAQLKLDVLYDETKAEKDITFEDWSKPAAYMLLIKAESLERFFNKRELPTDTCAILATLAGTTNDDGTISYYYSYDISTLLTSQVREVQAMEDTAGVSEKTLSMVLIPVTVGTSTTSSSTVISSVKPEQVVSATVLRSASNSVSPMKLEVVYAGL